MRLADRRRQDHPRNTTVEQASDGRTFLRSRGGLAFFQHQLRALAAALIERAEQELAQVRGTGVAVEQADPDVFRTGQAARSRIWRVPQVFDGRENGFTRGLPDVAFAVYNSRNGHGGDAGFARDIM